MRCGRGVRALFLAFLGIFRLPQFLGILANFQSGFGQILIRPIWVCVSAKSVCVLAKSVCDLAKIGFWCVSVLNLPGNRFSAITSPFVGRFGSFFR